MNSATRSRATGTCAVNASSTTRRATPSPRRSCAGGLRPRSGAPDSRCDRRASHPSAHVLFAPRDGQRSSQGHPRAPGHEDLSTTLRYMHLSPAARESAIAVLNRRGGGDVFGEIVETGARSAQILGK
jgi:hypothetical protein